MGKTTQPLRLLVHPDLAERPEFQALREKGHIVDTGMPSEWSETNAWAYDAIFGSTAWRLTERHLPYLEDALKEARKRRYGKKEKQS